MGYNINNDQRGVKYNYALINSMEGKAVKAINDTNCGIHLLK